MQCEMFHYGDGTQGGTPADDGLNGRSRMMVTAGGLRRECARWAQTKDVCTQAVPAQTKPETPSRTGPCSGWHTTDSLGVSPQGNRTNRHVSHPSL